jgi:hypothetical protein
MRQNLLSSQVLKKNFRLLVSLVTFLSIILFYFWTATSNFKPFYFVFEKEPHTYHQLIADGFLHGHLYLNIEPPKELLNLPNPYDPNLNVKYRLHDASLYHGKYYFYFTPLVAALFLIPFKLLTGYYLPDELLLSLFCSLGFIFSFLTLKKLLSFANIRLGLLNQIFSLLTLATATMVPFLMRRIAVYELCIGLGYCFLMMSLFCFLHCFDEKNKNLKKFLIVTGFLFGLTIWARPNQMIGIGGLVFSFLLINRFYFKKNIQTILIESSLMCLPVITVGLMMMLYNYLRFGSIFEFGVHYQLAGENQTKIPIMSIKNVLCSLLNYLFIKFSFYNIFPYFFLTTKPFLKSPFTYYHYEPVIGILSLPIFYFLGTFLFIKKLWVKSALFAYITFFIFI